MSTPASTRETEIRAKVRTYLEENFLYMLPDFVLGDDDRLLERGVVDSMGILEMLTFIEDQYGVKASDDEISEANLGSLRAIAHFVASKLAPVPA
jgi:acyl carrier protein